MDIETASGKGVCDAGSGEGCCPKQHRLLVYSRGGAQLGSFQQPLWGLT